MIRLVAGILTIFSVVMTTTPAMASGAAAQRRPRTGVRPHLTPTVQNTSSNAPASNSPFTPSAVQGPPVNLGRRQHSVYARPPLKSINLPRLPNEHVEEPEEKSTKPVAPPKKVQQQYYPPSRVLTSSSNTTTLARASTPAQTGAAYTNPTVSPELAAIFERLDQSSELWVNIKDIRAKGLIVEHYVDLYKQFGINISKPADYYANMIDAMAHGNPRLLTQPFDQVLRAVSILEYDYDSGENKDGLAISILGNQKAVLENRKRLGIK